MILVMAQINATNPNDHSLRIWGLGVDKVPRGNWTRDDAIIKSERYQGDKWTPEVNIPDGDHIIYFVVSQTSPDRGGYNGAAIFGKAGFTFQGVDNDTIAPFHVTVKNGVVSRKSAASLAPNEDIPENAPKSGFIRKLKLDKLADGLKGMRSWGKWEWVKFATVTGGIIGGGILAYVVIKKVKKSRF